MAEESFFDKLVEVTKDEDTAKKIIAMFDRTQTRIGLTEAQARVLAYLESGQPITSQRQLAKDCGFDHPQKLVSTLAALVVKGYLRPRKVIEEEK